MSESDEEVTDGAEASSESVREHLTGAGDGPEDGLAEGEAVELLAEVELLREENRRLRESYVQAKTTQYRRTAVGFAALGLTATLGAAISPAVRTVLLALGGTGLFAAVTTYYLTPERFVAADVGAQIYDALVSTHAAIISELGLEDDHVYVPIGEANTQVRLFIPQHEDYTIPTDRDLQSLFVMTDTSSERGVALTPMGSGLFDEFERALAGPLGATVSDLLPQLREGLVEQFEIVDDLEYDAQESGDRISIELQNDIYGDVSRFDHPARSFIAVGLARGLDTPIRMTHADANTTTVSFRRVKTET